MYNPTSECINVFLPSAITLVGILKKRGGLLLEDRKKALCIFGVGF
jgi:hypothetical protein